jgi:dolichol-phosphate mannosyltransferase
VGSLLRQEFLPRMAVPSHPWASVIVPIKDERDNLVPLLEGLLTAMSSHAASQIRPFEIIFVDDGSSDGSSETLDRLATQHSQVRVFHLDRNYGKTCAIEAGFSQSSGDLIIELDGDLQQDSKDILKLLPYTETYDVVCGWRQERQDGLVKKMSSRIANRVRNFFIHDGVHDTGCPLKIFRRPVLERVPLFEGMHRFFPALALMHGFTVTEVPVRHFKRIHGVSKYGMGNRLFKSLYDLFAVRWMQTRVLRYRFAKGEGPEARG